MSTSSSEEGSGIVSRSANSSGLDSAGSLLFSVPSDCSDVRTEATPPISPALSEGKMPTPRDILDASRRLGQISASALRADATPTRPPKQLRHRVLSKSVVNDEAGYDADADGDGDTHEDGRARAGAGAGATTPTRPLRRPTFLRIDTRQHRRVASMLAIRRPGPGFGDVDAHAGAVRPLRAGLAPLSSVYQKSATAAGGHAESYELRRRPRQSAELVGLGIGFPENHPLRGRAFTAPAPTPLGPPSDDSDPDLDSTGRLPTTGQRPGLKGMQTGPRRSDPSSECERSPPSSPAWSRKTVEVRVPLALAGAGVVYAPSPVRLALRPTFMEASPSPIEYLPGAVVDAGAGAGTFRCGRDVEVDDRGRRRAVGTSVSEAGTERRRCAPCGAGETAGGFVTGVRVDCDVPRHVRALDATTS